jgi:hypothetical protein
MRRCHPVNKYHLSNISFRGQLSKGPTTSFVKHNRKFLRGNQSWLVSRFAEVLVPSEICQLRYCSEALLMAAYLPPRRLASLVFAQLARKRRLGKPESPLTAGTAYR